MRFAIIGYNTFECIYLMQKLFYDCLKHFTRLQQLLSTLTMKLQALIRV